MFRIKSLDGILATAAKKPLHRALGPFQLTLFGIGSVIGTGIFVLSAEAAQKAGPGMVFAFVIAAAVCAVAGLCYAEMASMIPVAGSAYTYSYAVLGEFTAWLVGWALILEYGVSGAAIAVGWSGYFTGLLAQLPTPVIVPALLAGGPNDGGLINLPAVIATLVVTVLLVIGTRESARVNAVLVAVKLMALAGFIALALPAMRSSNFLPFAPWGTGGIAGAAASIFFAYIGFDGVSTAAEETRNPQRNLPIALIATLVFCTLIYVLVAVGAIGAYGAQPVFGPHGETLATGSAELTARCAALAAPLPLVCSNEALAFVLRQIGHPLAGNLVGLAAGLALPSVLLLSVYGQTRIFFAMARDGLLPEALSAVHPRLRTPHVVTWLTGAAIALAAAFFPVGRLADFANSGTLFAFLVVAVAVMRLRVTEPGRARPFRTPMVWLVGPLTVIGCLGLFLFLPIEAKLLFPVWSAIGLVFYFAYGFRHSHVGRGIAAATDETLPE
jgi:APA family basic amino acid/polyamine antiporter